VRKARPFRIEEVEVIGASPSPSTGLRYGLRRACRVLGYPRSSLYARQARRVAKVTGRRCLMRRGPKPRIRDEQLLAFIRMDLERTPFSGEGYRKVWARLRIIDGVRVARKRVLRVMRENHLLSPHRGRPKQPQDHEGTIITSAPYVMWGTDGSKVLTVEEGWGWIFSAVDHFNAECVGWHVCKIGNRFAALEPVSQGLTEHFGSVGREVARGLALRLDHGTQYLSDYFLNQVRFWGITPSFAFVSQPQTNGVVERFNRTLKEQVIHGRVFRNLAEVREAVGEFVRTYNEQWRLEKLGYTTPVEARESFFRRAA
jgi:putative transposase